MWDLRNHYTRGMIQLPIAIEIGLRYTRAKNKLGVNKRDGFLSFISGISMAGIALGVAALIVVLSVMNGFQKDVRDKMLSVLSHVEVMSAQGIQDWEKLAEFVQKQPHVIGVAPLLQSQALLTNGDLMRGAGLRGISPEAESKVSDLPNQFRVGSINELRPGEFGIALGGQLADTFGVKLGDRISVMIPQGDLTPAGMMPRLRAFKVVGILDTGHYEFDSTLALIHWQDAAALARSTGPTGLRVKLDDMQLAPKVASSLNGLLPGDLYVSDWSSQNRNWFAAVKTEKRMMFIILTLIIAVAAFNLVSTLVMTVTDKQADIAILRTMGASARMIQQIFFVQGLAIGILGSVIGVALGLLIACNIDVIVPFIEAVFKVQFLPRDVYLVSELPSDVRSSDVITVGGMAFFLSLLATLYPSWRAAKVKPAEALRYE